MPGVNQGVSLERIQAVIEGVRTKFKTGFIETQGMKAYKLQKLLLGRAETATPEHGFEWTIRIKSAQGSTQKRDPFEVARYQRNEPMVKLKVSPFTLTTHTNMWFDDLVDLINTKASTKLWNEYKGAMSGAEEEKAATWESLLLNPPTVDEGSNECLGLLYWYRRSMTSGGVFVRQPTPARNGVYYRDGSGTVSSKMAGRDVAQAAMARLRGLVATHDGVMDDNLLITLEQCIDEMNIEYLDELEGDKSSVDLVILWDEVFGRAYSRKLKALGAPLTDDYFPNRGAKVASAKVFRIPSFNNHFLRPIFGINLAETKFRKTKGYWERMGHQVIGHTMHAFPEDSRGQLWAENVSQHGFLIHGQFSTGT